jgi:hypothetical protein
MFSIKKSTISAIFIAAQQEIENSPSRLDEIYTPVFSINAGELNSEDWEL